MIKLKNLADLKRNIKVGIKVNKTKSFESLDPIKARLGIRTVTHAQTNSFAIDNCWLEYDKADTWAFFGNNVFQKWIPSREGGSVFIGEYEILEPTEEKEV